MYLEQNYIDMEECPQLPPPDDIPTYCPNLNNVMPKLLKNCLHTDIYIWMKNDDKVPVSSFWIYPIYVDANILLGYYYHWNRWVFVVIYLRDIDSFY